MPHTYPCKKEGCSQIEDELHHLVPKSIGGTDADGRAYLCKKHHDILHQMLLKIVFTYVPDDKRAECRNAVKKFSEKWIDS